MATGSEGRESPQLSLRFWLHGSLGKAGLFFCCIACHLLFQVQGASFRGWKEVTSLFNKDDEQHLLERCKSPKSRG